MTVNLSYLSDYSLVVFFDWVRKQNIDATFCLNWVGQSDSANRLHNQGYLLKGIIDNKNHRDRDLWAFHPIFRFSIFILVDEVTKNKNRLHDFLYNVFLLQGKTGKTKTKTNYYVLFSFFVTFVNQNEKWDEKLIWDWNPFPSCLFPQLHFCKKAVGSIMPRSVKHNRLYIIQINPRFNIYHDIIIAIIDSDQAITRKPSFRSSLDDFNCVV